jgi:TetR/AcrR family transcriptional regulator
MLDILTLHAKIVRMSAARLDQILGAAYRCFSRHGVRRTTMEDIAGEAGLSRPALYQYVTNKQDAFRRLAQRLFAQALTDARTAAATPVPVEQRLYQVLETKLELTLRLFHDSPHAAELLDEGTRLTGDLVAAYTAELVEVVAATLREPLGPDARDVAEVAVALVRGLEADLTDPETPRRRLRLGVRLLTSGTPTRLGEGR